MENQTHVSDMTNAEFDIYMAEMIRTAASKRTGKTLAVFEGFRKQVAKRSDGTWFERTCEFNGYGKGWTKWKKAALVVLVNENGEQYQTEGTAYDLTLEIPNRVMGGFSGDLYRTELNARLPK